MRRSLFVALLSPMLALAQHHPVPAGGPEKPVVLWAGLGNWQHPVATRNPEAQKYFNQGLALLYGFNRYEALRSFRKASELDPQAAMAYWGMAMSQGPYINQDMDPTFNIKASCAALEPALKLTAAPDRDRAYVQAAASRCPEYKPETYAAAMRSLVERYPDDLDAQTLYAESLMIPTRWHWYGADGAPAAGVAEAEHVLEAVLRRWPDHPGANHLYIHAVESSPSPERAIASAQRLMGIVPWAGHLVHMPGHIWLVLGDWETAVNVNERAVTVDREYLAASNVTDGSYAFYYVHNLHFIAFARWMQGRKSDGIRAADEVGSTLAPFAESMPEMVDAFLAVPIFARVRFGAWDDILKMPQPGGRTPVYGLAWRFARALAYAAKGDGASAARERDAFEAGLKALPADAAVGNSKAVEVLGIASASIAARLATTPAEAASHWQRAVEMQDRLVYDEPPDWFYPVRESLGAALLRAGKAREAETVFREGVRRSPRNGRMLFGLLESLRAQNKTDAADSVRKEFDANWAKADIKLRIEDL